MGRLLLALLTLTRLASVRERDVKVDNETGRTAQMVECNNLTLINLILRVTGPMREDSLTLVLLGVQVACSLLAFAIRYPLAYLLYGEIVA